MTERTPWVLAVPLLGVVACANVWGFDDLTLADGGTSDATAPGDVQVTGAEGGGGDDGAADGAVENDATGGDAADAQREGDGGEGGGFVGEGGNAGDAAALAAYCATHCPMGCCDTNNQCVTKPSATSCGLGGQACVNCGVTETTCTFATPACCNTSSGKCGCTALTLCTTN